MLLRDLKNGNRDSKGSKGCQGWDVMLTVDDSDDHVAPVLVPSVYVEDFTGGEGNVRTLAPNLTRQVARVNGGADGEEALFEGGDQDGGLFTAASLGLFHSEVDLYDTSMLEYI